MPSVVLAIGPIDGSESQKIQQIEQDFSPRKIRPWTL